MTKAKRRSEQLGMPYGTASNKLRKMLMFKFAQELGYDTCYACGCSIETADELSVEHKQPWEGRPNGTELFWDLNNIAFSHIGCNKPHTYRQPRTAPEGKAWCGKHKEFLPIVAFNKDKSRPNGLEWRCKECKK